MKYVTFDDYFWPNQSCMRNLLGIHNQIQLDTAVDDVVSNNMTLLQIEKSDITVFNGDVLRDFHGYLFGDCYDWAGTYRTCPMGRNMDYCDPNEISEKINAFCERFQKSFVEKRFESVDKMGDELARSWAELNIIHPFRDGNGRSQYAFFYFACKAKGFNLGFSKADLKIIRTARDSASEGQLNVFSNILRRSLTVVDEKLANKNIYDLRSLELESKISKKKKIRLFLSIILFVVCLVALISAVLYKDATNCSYYDPTFDALVLIMCFSAGMGVFIPLWGNMWDEIDKLSLERERVNEKKCKIMRKN